MRRNRWLVITLAIALVAAIAIVWSIRRRSAASSAAAAREPDQQARTVPVLAAAVEAARRARSTSRGSAPSTAFKTVTVKSQVDGRLDKVLLPRGAGRARRATCSPQIDPRPFQIQLHQAEARSRATRPSCAAPRRNLERYRALAAEKLIPQQQVDDQQALGRSARGRGAASTRRRSRPRGCNLDYARITLADRRRDRRAPGRPRQPGPRQPTRTGIVVVTQLDPIAVLFTLPQDDLPAASPSELAQGALAVEALQPRRRDAARHRRARAHRQPDQPGHRDHPAQGGVPEPDARAVAEPVRQGAPAARRRARTRWWCRRRRSSAGRSGTFVYVVGAGQTAPPRPVEIDADAGRRRARRQGARRRASGWWSTGRTSSAPAQGRVARRGEAAARGGARRTRAPSGEPAQAASERRAAP